jgi:hypothetical protein
MPTLQTLDLSNGFRNAMRGLATTERSVGRVNIASPRANKLGV